MKEQANLKILSLTQIIPAMWKLFLNPLSLTNFVQVLHVVNTC